MHGDANFAFTAAPHFDVVAARGRNVVIIAPDGGANMALGGQQIIGGVEANPVITGQQHFAPGVGRVGYAAVVRVQCDDRGNPKRNAPEFRFRATT